MRLQILHSHHNVKNYLAFLPLAPGMVVSLIDNKSVNLGLCNGTTGKVYKVTCYSST